ncbi:MAG: hypothetical protein JMDDDDMK_01744 [Acidobacteria bacterium]|nr:hypothetical protein [Acidobacteriota bacterium]
MYTVTREERNWGMLSHLLALVGFFAIPFGNVIAPLIVYLMKKDESPFVADQSRESLNFQISLCIYALISGVLVIVLVGFLLLAVIWIGGVVLTIIASVKAANGEAYRYPLTLRLIS